MYDLVWAARPGSSSTCTVVSSQRHQRPGAHLLGQQLHERPAPLGHLQGPSAHRGARDLDAEPLELFGLPIEGDGIGELRREYVGQQPCRGDAFGDQVVDRRCDHHRRPLVLDPLTDPARVLGADVADDLDPRRHDVEPLGALLPDPALARPAPTLLVLLGHVVHHLHPRQMCGQGLAAPLFGARVGRDDDLGFGLLLRFGRDRLGFVKEIELSTFGFGEFLGSSSK
jgi:hypothetical protein